MLGPVALGILVVLFIVSYIAIALEFYIKVNKTAVGIALAGASWLIYFLGSSSATPKITAELSKHFSDVSQVIFFLLGAMTLVELIDSHKGFNTVARLIHSRSKKRLLITIAIITFALSALLDNLTTTILMISLVRKLVTVRKERIILGCLIVMGANSGGAWTPIGDVTTTMLWINDRISTFEIMRAVFLPSVVSMLIPLLMYLVSFKGEFPEIEEDLSTEQKEPGGQLIFVLGISILIMVPILKWAIGIPPFMGMLIGLAILWFVTDLLHFKHPGRSHLRVPYILTKIDVSSILFFLGILLSVNALEAVGFLRGLANWLSDISAGPYEVATGIGLISAVMDNVPLVAAVMGMYSTDTFPMDSPFWFFVSYAAGVGGSLLSIGSAAGVALMGMEKVDFMTYVRKASLPALFGYIGGILVFLVLN